MKPFLGFLVVFIALLMSHPRATVLGDLAGSLKPGQWAELKTTGFDGILQDGPSFITAYADNAVWDPVSRSFLFIGQGHNSNWDNNPSTNSTFIGYNEATNHWDILPDIISPDGNIGHSYDHSAIDPVARKFYHRVRGGKTVYTYHIDQKKWENTLPQLLPGGSAIGGYSGLDFNPQSKALILYDGQNSGLHFLPEGAGQWENLMKTETSTYHNMMEHNSMHKVTIFGGGNGVRNLYKMDADKKITRQKDAPIGIGITQTLITSDPGTGKYLVFADGRKFYEYDVVSDTWALQNNAAPLFDANRDKDDVSGIVAAPVSTHNVIMFLTWDFHRSKVLIYKHSIGEGVGVQTPVFASSDFSPGLFPNPFRKSFVVRFPAFVESGHLNVVNALGVSVFQKGFFGTSQIVRFPNNLPHGPYFLKGQADGRDFSKKLFLKP